MGDKKYSAGYIITTLLDFGLTFVGSAGVIVYNYISPENSSSFKISLTGIVLLIALVLTAKTIFERRYQDKENALLQQLGSATDPEVKKEVNKEIDQHRLLNLAYQRLVIILPFIILGIITNMGVEALSEMHGTVNIITLSMSGGSIFHVIRKPLKDRADRIKLANKIKR